MLRFVSLLRSFALQGNSHYIDCAGILSAIIVLVDWRIL